LKSSQSRVAKIEAGTAGVSLDLLFRALFAVGGGLADLTPPGTRQQARRKVWPPAKRQKRAAK
jgi:hypothetical protein